MGFFTGAGAKAPLPHAEGGIMFVGMFAVAVFGRALFGKADSMDGAGVMVLLAIGLGLWLWYHVWMVVNRPELVHQKREQRHERQQKNKEVAGKILGPVAKLGFGLLGAGFRRRWF